METQKVLFACLGISIGLTTILIGLGNFVYADCSDNCYSECSYGQRACAGTTGYKVCSNFDCDPCYEWSSTYSCCSDKVCNNGYCVAACTDECSYGDRRCYDSGYQVCSNFDSDSCYEWSSTYSCGSGKTCSNGQCVTTCTSHSYKQCYAGDVYWYDSCGDKESKYEDCGSDYTGSWSSNYCKGDDVYRKRTVYDRGCSGSSCYSNTDIEEVLVEACDDTCSNGQCVTTCTNECSYGQRRCSGTGYQVCGDFDCDSCHEWSSTYSCGSGKVCSDGQCVTSCVSHSYKQCYVNDLYWYDSCGHKEEQAEDCGSSGWSDEYRCSPTDWMEYVQRQWVYRTCTDNQCQVETEWRDYESCNQTVGKVCSNGECVWNCTSHSYKSCYNDDVYWYDSCGDRESKYEECGSDYTSSWGADYCKGDDVYESRTVYDRGCSSNSCYSNSSTEERLVKACDDTCSNGQCVTTCTSHSYKQCYAGDVYWYDSCGDKEEKVDECGSDSWTDERRCSGSNTVERKWIDRGCSGSSCYENEIWKYQKTCSSGEICSGGECIDACTSHSYKSCYNDDVYWYDSCGDKEEKVDECGNDEWGGDYRCSNNYVQRQWFERGCSAASCYENTSWLNYQNCSATDQTCSNGVCIGSTLNISCYASPNSIEEGENTTFYSNVSGGTGTYSYYWSNACSGTSQNCSQTFYSLGNYTANLTVTSGTQTDTASCSVYVSEPSCECNSWSSWEDQGCGISSCDSDEMYQTKSRVCTPYGCADSYETRCIADSECEPQCEDECSYSGQERCYGNGVQTCGNYDSDSCLEWSSTESCSGSTSCGYGTCDNDERPYWYCSNGDCEYSCSYDNDCDVNDHDYRNCYNNDVYWYDSYGNRNDKYEDCGSDYTGSWGSYYCKGDDVYKSRVTYDKGCSGSSCYTYTDTEEKLVERCDYDCEDGECVDDDDDEDYKRCYNNDVYWYSYNGYRQSKYEECGSDYTGSWGSTYCKGDNVYKQRYVYDRGCTDDECYSDREVEEKLVERCDYDCKNGKCVEDDDECTSGPCCDDGEYKDDDVVCKSDIDVRYGCPWGTSCGADVGVRSRIRFQYCSGDSASCNGDWGSWGYWTNWTVTDYCSTSETCSVGQSTCSYNSSCSYTPPSNTKGCYDGDVYWFDSYGNRLSKYDECDDQNSCTQDSCSNAVCINTLQCDGSTCSQTSDEYCASCTHCGDGIANCEENFCTCSADVDLPETSSIAVSVLAKSDEDYKKNLTVEPNDTINFLVVVASSATETIDNIVLDNILPSNIVYQGNLKINGIPFTGNVLAGIGLGSLQPNESKHISFDAEVAGSEYFDLGTTYLSNISKITYDNQTKSDSAGIEVTKGSQGVAAAGSLFSQALKILGSLAFWLVMLFIFAVIVFLGITGYYWVRKRRMEKFA